MSDASRRNVFLNEPPCHVPYVRNTVMNTPVDKDGTHEDWSKDSNLYPEEPPRPGMILTPSQGMKQPKPIK